MSAASHDETPPGTILVPVSTGAPLILAVGLTLLLAGLVTNVSVSVVGGVLAIAGAVGWFREVLPHPREEALPLVDTASVVVLPHAALTLAVGEDSHRARLPVKIYPYSAGLRGGIAGGAAMAVLAILYGLLVHGSPWYPVNLLAAAGSATLSNAGPEVLNAFHLPGIVLAVLIHGALSVLVGLLYGALLPMLPRYPAFWGGVIAPLMWTGLIASALHVINPALNARIDWPWFVASQIAFGCVAGLVVERSERVSTFQHLPLAVRAGIERQVPR